MSAELVVRHAQGAVDAALGDTRVVIVLGARQGGKSTLLEQVNGDVIDLPTISRHPDHPAAAVFTGCRRRDSNPRHADYDSAALTD
jgi:hypothetical protein